MYGLTFGLSIPGHRHRRGALPEAVHPGGDLHPGAPRWAVLGTGPQDHRRQPDRCAGGLDPQAAQDDRAVAGHRAGRLRRRHPGGVHRRDDQEPVEAGRADRRGKKAVLWTSGWTPVHRRDHLPGPRDRHAGSPPFVKMRPEDLDAGAMETVFPWRESDGDGTTVESHERLSEIAMGVRNPVMLIRIKPVDMPRLVKRQGQESFNFGELFAYTKVCSHLGCRPRCTSSRPTASCARATNPSSTHCISRVRSSGRPHAHWHSCRSPLIKRATWSPTATSLNLSDPHSGSAHHEFNDCRTPGQARGDEIDSRYHPSAAVRRQLNKVFPPTGRSCSARSRCTASSCCC